MANVSIIAASMQADGCSDGDPYQSNESDLYSGWTSVEDACAEYNGPGVSFNAYFDSDELEVGTLVTTRSNALNIFCDDDADTEPRVDPSGGKWFLTSDKQYAFELNAGTGEVLTISTCITPTPTATHSHTVTDTHSPTATDTHSPTATDTFSPTATHSITDTYSPTHTITNTHTPTHTAFNHCLVGREMTFHDPNDPPTDLASTTTWEDVGLWQNTADQGIGFQAIDLFEFEVHSSHDGHSFEFTTCDDGTAGGSHATTGGMHTIDTAMCIYDESGTLVGSNDDGPMNDACDEDSTGYGSYVKLTLDAGKYYVALANDDSEAGNYALAYRRYGGTPTVTATFSATVTHSLTNTYSPTATDTHSPTHTPTQTVSVDATATHTPTATYTPLLNEVSPTPTATEDQTNTHTPTVTDTFSPTATHSPTVTMTASVDETSTHSHTVTDTHTPTVTDTFSPTATHSITDTHSPTATYTPTATFTASVDETNTHSPTATDSPTQTVSVDATATHTPTATNTTPDSYQSIFFQGRATGNGKEGDPLSWQACQRPRHSKQWQFLLDQDGRARDPVFQLFWYDNNNPWVLDGGNYPSIGEWYRVTASTNNVYNNFAVRFSQNGMVDLRNCEYEVSPTSTATYSPTETMTASVDATDTHSPTATDTFSPTATHSITDTHSSTATYTPTATFTASVDATNTHSPTATDTFSPTATHSITETYSPTATFTHTHIPAQVPTGIPFTALMYADCKVQRGSIMTAINDGDVIGFNLKTEASSSTLYKQTAPNVSGSNKNIIKYTRTNVTAGTTGVLKCYEHLPNTNTIAFPPLVYDDLATLRIARKIDFTGNGLALPTNKKLLQFIAKWGGKLCTDVPGMGALYLLLTQRAEDQGNQKTDSELKDYIKGSKTEEDTFFSDCNDCGKVSGSHGIIVEHAHGSRSETIEFLFDPDNPTGPRSDHVSDFFVSAPISIGSEQSHSVLLKSIDGADKGDPDSSDHKIRLKSNAWEHKILHFPEGDGNAVGAGGDDEWPYQLQKLDADGDPPNKGKYFETDPSIQDKNNILSGKTEKADKGYKLQDFDADRYFARGYEQFASDMQPVITQGQGVSWNLYPCLTTQSDILVESKIGADGGVEVYAGDAWRRVAQTIILNGKYTKPDYDYKIVTDGVPNVNNASATTTRAGSMLQVVDLGKIDSDHLQFATQPLVIHLRLDNASIGQIGFYETKRNCKWSTSITGTKDEIEPPDKFWDDGDGWNDVKVPAKLKEDWIDDWGHHLANQKIGCLKASKHYIKLKLNEAVEAGNYDGFGADKPGYYEINFHWGLINIPKGSDEHGVTEVLSPGNKETFQLQIKFNIPEAFYDDDDDGDDNPWWWNFF